MNVIVKAVHDESLGARTISFEFNKWDWNQVKAVVDLMKLMIPVSDRMYDSDSKQWTVTNKYWGYISEIFTKAGFRIEEAKHVDAEDFFYNQGTATPVVESKDSLAAKLISMLGITAQDLADSGLLKKAYRKKALEWHPDRNQGDGSKMSELNAVWSAYNGN